jgi:hypothetical protein
MDLTEKLLSETTRIKVDLKTVLKSGNYQKIFFWKNSCSGFVEQTI